MSELHLVRHCSPTLAGMKTGSMFSCEVADFEDLKSFLRNLNLRLKKKGLRVIPIRFRDKKVLIYVFRPDHLERDLKDGIASRLLRDLGYSDNPVLCVRHLIRRLGDNDAFPHEIGLFLGYPPEDVRGFMEDPGACKCVGHWKVYGDEEKARKTFAKYKKCSAVYTRQWEMGKSLERLTVAI